MSVSRARRSGIQVSTSPKKSRSLQDASGLPGPVQTFTATPTGNTTASLSWSAPVNSGDSAITSYTVTGGGSISIAGTTATVTGLVANTNYTFTIVAVNSIGSGVPSSSSQITTFNFNSATGGTTVDVTNYNSTGQTWRVHTFTSPGTFTVTASGNNFSRLALGGGGGGGGCNAPPGGGGGGGGSVQSSTTQTLSNTSYAITVGGGGGGGNDRSPGGGGGTTTIAGIVSSGGGGGGGESAGSGGACNTGCSGGTTLNITGSNVLYGQNGGQGGNQCGGCQSGTPGGGGGGAAGGFGIGAGSPGQSGRSIFAYRIA